jgi:hypothetical protein
VCLDRHPIADREFVDRLAERDDRPGPLVAGRELPEWRLTGERMRLDFEVGAAGATHGNLDQCFARPGPWDRLVDHAQVVWSH